MACRIQLTSDGHKPYLEAVEASFGGAVDYAMLVKIYGPAPEGQRRYSPPVCTGARRFRVEGKPDISAQLSENQFDAANYAVGDAVLVSWDPALASPLKPLSSATPTAAKTAA